MAGRVGQRRGLTKIEQNMKTNPVPKLLPPNQCHRPYPHRYPMPDSRLDPVRTQIKPRKETSIMKTKPILILSSVLCLSGPAMLFAAAFDSGSDGSYGALTVGYNIITNLDMPPDGIFKCTTITIGSSAQGYFNRNARNTPGYLLAQSNVVIHGTINLLGRDYSGSNPGRGRRGGLDGGFGTVQGYAASDGQRPGGGKVSGSGNRAGVFAYPRAQNSNIYGNTLLVPLVGGSGGAGSAELAAGGGGGGGIGG